MNSAAVGLLSAVSRVEHAPRITLLGTGVVGSQFIDRYLRLQQQGLPLPAITGLVNSRQWLPCDPSSISQQLKIIKTASSVSVSSDSAKTKESPHWVEQLHANDIVVDATASESVAAQHTDWLRRGVHVVTANKQGIGGSLERFQALESARQQSGAYYGDAATVGAGLPLIASLRALAQGGDRITQVEGILSGSLAWLFNHYDGMRPFSGFVRQAREAGYTEPDPREDLSGEDVRRKVLILARAAGFLLKPEQVQVQSLVPANLAALPLSELDAALPELDAPLRHQFETAYKNGERLRFIGKFNAEGASVGLQALPLAHALCGGGGTDNRVAISSDRYPHQPLVIQGPGAGAEVTAAALLDDVLKIARTALCVSTVK